MYWFFETCVLILNSYCSVPDTVICSTDSGTRLKKLSIWQFWTFSNNFSKFSQTKLCKLVRQWVYYEMTIEKLIRQLLVGFDFLNLIGRKTRTTLGSLSYDRWAVMKWHLIETLMTFWPPKMTFDSRKEFYFRFCKFWVFRFGLFANFEFSDSDCLQILISRFEDCNRFVHIQ